LPAARLADAHQARRNGDYAAAQAELESVLQAPDAEWQATEARYQIGVIAYLDGEYKRSQEMLTQFIEKHPEDSRTGTAHFFLAEALSRTQEHTAAVEHYAAYLEQQGVLADIVYTRIGKNHEALGSYPAAVEAYELALAHAPDLGQQYDLREQIALAYSAWGRYEPALDWLRGITERSKNVYRLARVWYLVGETYRLAGQQDQALNAYAQAVNGDPRPAYAHRALQELVDAGVEVNDYQRGLIDYHAGSSRAAVAAFSRYIEAQPDPSSDATYHLALSHLEAGFPDRAIEEVERSIARLADTDAHWGDLWLLKGDALTRLDDEAKAVATYIAFAETNPNHLMAPEARWRAAQSLEQAGHFLDAADQYTALANAHPNAEQAPPARFRAGISRHRSGDRRAAVVAWKELIDRYPASSESMAARYWIGKSLWAQGQTEEARLVLQSLAEEYPRDYYALRASHLIQSGGKARPWHIASERQVRDHLHVTEDDHEEQHQVANWLRSWAGAPQGSDPTAVSADLAGHLLFRRAMEMNTLALRTQARDTFEQLRYEVAQDALSLYQLALVTRDLELYAPSLRATINLIALAPEASVLDMPRPIQRLAFPSYFADLVLAECATQSLDPLLMLSLIRQESVFDSEATSWAGAVGLTQVMPSTGEWIAEMTAWPTYDDEMLRRAYLNVKFGVWFLARILEQTDGNVMTALAGYNGGPARAQKWWEQSGGDPDLFVEVITREEPRRYVKLIYRHYDVYARLYGGQ
jgi:soluble lytic murein transglycosylase